MFVKYFQLIYIIVLFVFVSCTRKRIVPVIDLSSPESTEITLSDIADSIVYYPIALEEDSRMPQYIELLADKIWASYYLQDLSDSKGDFFDRTSGKRLNQISFGPVLHKKRYAMDGYATNSHFVFSHEDWLTVPPAINTQARSYTLDARTGEEMEAIPFSIREIKSASPQRLNDSTFLVVTDLVGFGGKDSVRPDYSIRWYDTQMHPIKTDWFTDSIYRINRLKFISLLRDRIYIHADCTSTIYELSKDKKPAPVYRYSLGGHTPSVAANSRLVVEGRFEEYYSSSYYNLHSSMLADNYIFGAFDHKGKIFHVLHSRKTEKTWVMPTDGKSDGRVYSYKEGIRNDLDGGFDFWPKNVSRQGEIYTWYDAGELKAQVARSPSGQMKNPEAARRLKDMLDNLSEDVNYIVVVLKEKKQN